MDIPYVPVPPAPPHPAAAARTGSPSSSSNSLYSFPYTVPGRPQRAPNSTRGGTFGASNPSVRVNVHEPAAPIFNDAERVTVVYGAVNCIADPRALDASHSSRSHRNSQHPTPTRRGQPSQGTNNGDLQDQLRRLRGLFNNLYNQHGALDRQVQEHERLLTTLLPGPVEDPETVTYNPAAPPPPPYAGGPCAERPPSGASQRGTPVHRVNVPPSTGPQGYPRRPATPRHARRNSTSPSPQNLSRGTSPRLAQPVAAQHLTVAQIAAIEQQLQSGPPRSGMSSPTTSVTSAQSRQPVISPPGLQQSRHRPSNGGPGAAHSRRHSNTNGPPSRLGTPHHSTGLASSKTQS